ncbi:MAG: recombinase family protein [Anaerolineales bacterium]|nr:recombinase family protein [Anaerolineales bacterium]
MVEDEADVIRYIFELYAREGLSIRGIAEHLTDDDIPSPTGRSSWGKSTITKILRNETYIGTNYYNKSKRNGKDREQRAREKWIPIDTTPIVDPRIFREVQEKLRRNKAVRRQEPRRFYLLSGMVYCPDCGRPYACQTQKAGKHRRKNDAPQYRHRSREGHCRNRIISARKVDPVVWSRIVEVLLDPDNLRKGYEESLEQQQATTKRQRLRLETLERARQKHEKKGANLMTAYLDPDIQLTKTEYLQQRTAIEDELKTLDAEIDEIRTQLASVAAPPEFETIEAFAGEVREQLEGADDLSPPEKRKILELLHVRVFIPEEGELWLEGWFDPPRERQSITSR